MKSVIVASARTPFCKAGTALAGVSPVELGRTVLVACLERAGLEPSCLDAVIAGNVSQPADAPNVARVIALRAGVPERIPAHTVSRNCASGMEALVQAARLIRCGEASAVAVVGVESMSSIPFLWASSAEPKLKALVRARSALERLRVLTRFRPGDFKPVSALLAGLKDPICGLSMGETAEAIASEFGISREAQDRYAYRSQERTCRAAQDGVTAGELTPVLREEGLVEQDVGPRPGTTLDDLGRLRPIFEPTSGTVTAGNASMVTDGAAGLILMRADAAAARGISGRFAVVDHAVVGLDPGRMGLGPALALPAVLRRRGLAVRDLDLVELNEAFAAQVLACQAALASPAFAAAELDASEAPGAIPEERLNVNGGAISLGHPVGASGARIVSSLARELERRELERGVATLCVGGGQGQAVLLERDA